MRGGKFKDASLSFIRYRGVREDLDSRGYFLELGRRILPEVAPQIKARKLTPKFAKDWGVVMMCHGACFQPTLEAPMRRRGVSRVKFSDR
jgi:hypothetical protein